MEAAASCFQAHGGVGGTNQQAQPCRYCRGGLAVLLRRNLARRNKRLPQRARCCRIIASSLAVALVTVYLPHLANQWFSRQVGIGEKAIVLMLPRGEKRWRYHQISEVRFVQDTVAGEKLWIMVLGFKFMPPVGLGVAKNVDVAALAKRLRGHGVSNVIWQAEPPPNEHGPDEHNG